MTDEFDAAVAYLAQRGQYTHQLAGLESVFSRPQYVVLNTPTPSPADMRALSNELLLFMNDKIRTLDTQSYNRTSLIEHAKLVASKEREWEAGRKQHEARLAKRRADEAEVAARPEVDYSEVARRTASAWRAGKKPGPPKPPPF